MTTCFAFRRPVFQPSMRIITAITNAAIASVTTSFAHNYVTGTIVRLVIPLGVGMPQANDLFAPIVVTSHTTFDILIDTSLFDPFIIPSPPPLHYTCAQAVPMAEINSILRAAVHNALPYR